MEKQAVSSYRSNCFWSVRLKLLFRYIRPHAGMMALALFFTALNQVCLLLDPLILRRIMDTYVVGHGHQSAVQFFPQVGGLLLAGAAISAIAWGAKNFQIEYGYRLTRTVSLRIYSDGIRNSLGLPYANFAGQRSGQIIGEIQAARHDSEQFLSTFLNSIFGSAVSVLFLIIYTSRVHWSLIPAFLIAIPGLILASWLMSGRVRLIQSSIVYETSSMAGSATEVLRNIEFVKSLGLADQESERFDASSARILQLELEKARAIRRLSFFHGAAVHLLRLGLLLLMVYLVFLHQISAGQFLSLFLYIYMLFVPLQELGANTHLFRQTQASMKNMEELTRLKEPRDFSAPSHLAALETIAFQNVEFTHPGCDHKTLDKVTFQIASGETIAFVGQSGAGKTTLLKLLLRLYEPDAGLILFGGLSSKDIDFNQVRERIGLVTQDAQLFSGSLRDNLIFVRPEATDAECIEVLRRASAAEFLRRVPDGLDTAIGEGGIKLSGGEKQRLAIARALLRRPQLMIFDEATSSLDSLTEEDITRTIKSVSSLQQCIIIIIAHRLSTIMHADRIYVLDRGSILESGTHSALVNHPGLYRDIWLQQTGQGVGAAI